MLEISFIDAANAFVAPGGLAIALVAIHQTRHGLRTSADSAVFAMLQTFNSVEFHENVRRPAWHAMRKARRDPAYQQRLLTALSTRVREAEDLFPFHERRRYGKEPETEAEREYWAFHYESHRLLDIIGFFTILSLMQARRDVIRACGFFYDS